MTTLGFVGLGAMGAPMARNLLRAGYLVHTYARSADAAEQLRREGAVPADSPAALAERCDIVHTMVIDTAAVEDVVMGSHGLVHGARPGTVVVDHSTISPSATRRLAAQLETRSISLLDAPVSGGVDGAVNATLAIMVGGNEDVFERCRTVLSVLGQRIVYMGPSGAGQVTKACNQIALIVNQLGAAEAMLMAERSGVDPARVTSALMGGFGASRMLELQAPKMIHRDFTGKVESRLHYKDMLIALQVARELGIRLPASALAAELLGKLQDQGGARQDSAAVFTILEQLPPERG